jgi:hypothetical protein
MTFLMTNSSEFSKVPHSPSSAGCPPSGFKHGQRHLVSGWVVRPVAQRVKLKSHLRMKAPTWLIDTSIEDACFSICSGVDATLSLD